MFTGIIQAVGHIARIEPRAGDLRLRIDVGALDLTGVVPGDSIAVSGVCLTAIELDARQFAADVSRETLACSTLGVLREGAAVNLEKALRVGDALGGHLVAGHVDG
ncbi:riboflavin synthase, alpha subunit, partial [mine drainage metagenome]